MDVTGNLVATASGDFSVQIWDGITGDSLYVLPHLHVVKSCAFSPNSQYLATGGHEGILRIYDLVRMSPPSVNLMIDDPTLQAICMLPQNSTSVVGITKVAWFTDAVLLTGGTDGKINVWNIHVESMTTQPMTPIVVLETNGAEIRDMEVSVIDNTRQHILSVAAGANVFFFDLTTNALLKSHPTPIHFREEGGVSLHPTGTRFVAGGSDLWVRVFDYGTGAELDCYKGHHGPIRCIRYSPDGKSFASGSEDGTIRLWKTEAK
jgi:serine-threonine kinase receptor-associated protein